MAALLLVALLPSGPPLEPLTLRFGQLALGGLSPAALQSPPPGGFVGSSGGSARLAAALPQQRHRRRATTGGVPLKHDDGSATPGGGAPSAFHNAGTPPNVSRTFDCASRRHAWEFAKATLPQRGDFRTVFDALQLQACGLTPPYSTDTFTAPRFVTPPGTVLYAAATGTSAGDGSKSKPLTLEAAVAAAATAYQKPVTILLRGGVYRLADAVQLGPEHSNLTLQNFEGEEAVISGAAHVAVSKSAWSLANASTNTWQLDLKGQTGLFPNYGLRVGTQRGILAKYPNGDPQLSAVHMDSGSIPYGPGRYLNGSGRSMQIPTYFSRAHAPVNTTREFWARPEDWPGVIWHGFPSTEKAPMDGAGGYGAWFHAQGGVCSGRQVDYGYWCSANAPRSGSGRLQPPYNPPGGFLYASNSSLPQAGGYRNASGAVFHARGGTNPYFSYMCLVDSIDNVTGSVHFDSSVGCDQGGPTTTTGAAWDWFIEGVLEVRSGAPVFYLCRWLVHFMCVLDRWRVLLWCFRNVIHPVSITQTRHRSGCTTRSTPPRRQPATSSWP